MQANSLFIHEMVGFICYNGMRINEGAVYAAIRESWQMVYLGLEPSHIFTQPEINLLSYGVQNFHLILASVSRTSHFLLRIDKSPAYGEATPQTHMVAVRFNYYHSLFEVQDSSGPWTLVVPDDDRKCPNWCNFAWNLFKGAYAVRMYNFIEIERSKVQARHEKTVERIDGLSKTEDTFDIYD